MVSINLKVCTCPSKDLVYDNHLFTSKQGSAQLGFRKNALNFICIPSSPNSIIYPFKPHPEVPKNAIAISKIARQALRANTGDSITVKRFELPSDRNFNLVRAKFSLKSLTGSLEVDEAAFCETINTKLDGVVLSQGAAYIFDVHGIGYVAASVALLQVADTSRPEEGDAALTVRYGVLSQHAFVEIEAGGGVSILSRANAPGGKMALFGPQWKYADMGIGGLNEEFTNIFRRAFASRTLPPGVVAKLGVSHVKGLLLFGPPGTGKTLIARKIGQMLHGKEPKLVNGPEILNKYVGQSEENVRALFADAEADFARNGERADLHIVIFDEIDAICKQRGTTSGGTGVHDTVVNQLLSKMDGVDTPNNILVIGMTNRKDMIDPALLRPGRFEVHVEIGLPDKKGREEILRIHTKAMREHGFLSPDVDLGELASRTKNFSGAEIAGLVKSATSFAYYGRLDISQDDISVESVENIKIGMEAFERALAEVKSAFGVSEERLELLSGGGLIDLGGGFGGLLGSCEEMLKQFKSSEKTSLLTLLLEGVPNSGKTAVAAHLAQSGDFPFAKIISPEDFVGWADTDKCAQIRTVFEDAYKSPSSLLVLDDIERLLGYVDIGPRFSNLTLQSLLVLLKRVPPVDKKTSNPRKLCIIGTTSSAEILKEMGLIDVFMSTKNMPLASKRDLGKIMEHLGVITNKGDLNRIEEYLGENLVGIKTLVTVLEMAESKEKLVSYENFVKSAIDFGILKE